MADEAKDLTKNSENKLRAATEVFQRKYRSMSTYGEQVIDDANRSKKALFCLPEDNPIRFYCKKIVESKYPLLRSLKKSSSSFLIYLCLNFHQLFPFVPGTCVIFNYITLCLSGTSCSG